MPRVFLIKKNFSNGNSVAKSKKTRDERTITSQKYQDDSSDYNPNLYNFQDLTPPRTPSTDLMKTSSLEVSLIGSHADEGNNEFLSPKISESINVNTSTTIWPKTMIPPYLPFSFSSVYPTFLQPNTNADFYPQLYQVSLPQCAALPTESPNSMIMSPIKKPEPFTPLPVDANNSNNNVSSYLYRLWYAKKDPQIQQTSKITNSETTRELDDIKTPKSTREPPRYQCSNCNKSYSTMSGLSKHQQFHCASQVKKSFGCKYCDKVYVSLGALKMHIRTHTLPCKCKLCGKAFSRPWLLQGHVRTHTGEKPFACQHCNRAFADRSNLRAHLQTHSDVKKYSCKNCSKTFSRMSLLLKHEDGGCSGNKEVDGEMANQVIR